MNLGYLNEVVFINNINNKRYKETNPIVQELLKTLYPNIRDDDIITAYKYGKYAKVDVVVCVRNIKKGMSLKMGDKNSVHIEKIDKFCNFIHKNNFRQIDKLKRYLYSDDTNNNTGKNRYSSEEYKKRFPDDVNLLNQELEKIKKILIQRFLIKADINYKVKVDAFIYGTINDFIWATKEEVVDYLINKQFDTTGVHVSSLFIQNWDKNLKYNPRYEWCREYIQIKWFSLFDDIINIMCQRNYKNSLRSFQADCVEYKKKNSVITKFLKYIWSGCRRYLQLFTS